MQASDFDHRCTEPTCCVYGQPTTTSCLCHKSREEMMLAAISAERRAKEEAEREREDARVERGNIAEDYRELETKLCNTFADAQSMKRRAEAAETRAEELEKALDREIAHADELRQSATSATMREAWDVAYTSLRRARATLEALNA